MKINSTFLVHANGEETLLVPTGEAKFAGLVRCKGTAGFLLRALQKDCTLDSLTAKICGEYDVDPAVARKDIEGLLNQLRKLGALQEP